MLVTSAVLTPNFLGKVGFSSNINETHSHVTTRAILTTNTLTTYQADVAATGLTTLLLLHAVVIIIRVPRP